jgi:predicted GTPase
LNAIDADVIIDGSPIDLAKLVKVNKPIYRTYYDIAQYKDSPTIEDMLDKFIEKHLKK